MGIRERLTRTLNIEGSDLDGVRYTLRARIEGETEFRSGTLGWSGDG